ncbi:efflux transporter outer membrane subunit [Chondrinema litorale]|uniref:efflux transporter outer membrane subunit n=1 Tax=Chondrinema litorale TaxID=2994555 RepID=UPI002542FDBC|nr:TolC family protein [Chondrinema litorale]UZR96885.1 TolC family protein [Chondrinema litorale]
MEKNIKKIIPVGLLWLFSIPIFAQNSDEAKWKWNSGENDKSYLNVMKVGDDTLRSTPEFTVTENNHWWEAFGYNELNELAKQAISDNQNIKIAKSQTGIAKERVDVAKAGFFPSVSVNPSFTRQEFSANRPMQFDIAAQRVQTNTYSIPVNLSYEVDIFGKIKNSVDASRYNYEATAANQENISLYIASEVSRNFIQLITLDTENKILERTLSTRQENLEIVETRYNAGLTNEIDLQRAKTELSSVAVQLKSNQLRRTEIELALASLCGRPASSFSIPKTGIEYLAPDVNPLASASLASNRPDLKAAEFNIQAFEEQLKNSRKSLLPSLYLDGSAGLVSGSADHLFEENSRAWLAGATLAIPVFEGGRRRSQVAISALQKQAVVEDYKLQEQLANEDVERALSNLLRINEQLTAQQEFLNAAQMAAELSNQRYLKGLVTYLEVVDAERIVLEAERMSVQLLGEQLLSTVNLIVASGGDKGIVEFNR